MLGRFNQCWLAALKFFIKNARMIPTTAGMASSKHERVLPAEHIILDEASQMKECETVNTTARFHTARRISCFSDQKQLPPTHPEASKSEFTNITSFERLISVGHEVHLLHRQYRMNPEIARFVSQAFYDTRLINDPSTFNRADAALFRPYPTKWYNRAHLSLFVSVRNVLGRTQIYAKKESKSLVNPANATAVSVIIDAMRDEGISTSDIMVIVYYAAQVRLTRRWLWYRFGETINVSTIDGSQGKEAKYVIIDVVTPGGGMPLGFVADARRMNVALPRARDGRIVVVNEGMAARNYKTKAVELWGRYIEQHQKDGAVVRGVVSDRQLRSALHFPGE